MSDHFNKIARWIVFEVVHQPNIINRARVIKRFLKIAIKCKEYNNFNCCQEIIAGLGSSSLHRMKQTWARLKKNEQRLMMQFDTVKEILSNEKSFARYRSELKIANPPCLPYLGVFLTDLTFIDDGNPDYPFTKDRTDIINFDKMRKLAGVIEKMLIYQPQPYHFEKVPLIYDHIQNSLPQIEEPQAYEISLQIEPKCNI